MKLLSNLNANSVNIENLSNGVNAQDAVTKSQLDEVTNQFSNNIKYKGEFDASAGNFSAISPAQEGDFYEVTVAGTIDTVTYDIGDMILINKTTTTVTSADVGKIDNTEAADVVRLDDVQTITNKTINADNNTISNLEVDNFKSGTVITTVEDDDTKLPTAGAVVGYVGLELDSRRFTDNIGNGVDTVYTVNHNLNSLNVLVQLYDSATKEKIYVEYSTTDVNNVTVDFEDYVPGTDEFKITVIS